MFKISFFQYYVAGPAGKLWRKIAGAGAKVRRKITGAWWCDGCRTYHHGRVFAFSLDDWQTDPVCSWHVHVNILDKYEARVGNHMFRRGEVEAAIAPFWVDEYRV